LASLADDGLAGHNPVVVIVCGGAGVSRTLMDEWMQKVTPR
jgi:hypothetical protein